MFILPQSWGPSSFLYSSLQSPDEAIILSPCPRRTMSFTWLPILFVLLCPSHAIHPPRFCLPPSLDSPSIMVLICPHSQFPLRPFRQLQSSRYQAAIPGPSPTLHYTHCDNRVLTFRTTTNLVHGYRLRLRLFRSVNFPRRPSTMLFRDRSRKRPHIFCMLHIPSHLQPFPHSSIAAFLCCRVSTQSMQ